MSDDLRDRLWPLLGLSPVRRPQDWPSAATLLLPEGRGPHPVVLYCHAHGGTHALGRRELTEGARWLVAPYAPDLLAAGFAVACLDMPGFGDRLHEGSESALAKSGLWRGRPLFGQMVETQLAALDLLAADERIDAARMATLGVSMGAALAMWTAALDRRVAACAQLCMMANIEPLIRTGVHDRHGLYLTVPGLLGLADMGQIAGLVAPRPQFIGLGEEDHFTPPAARDPALAEVRHAYGGGQAPEIYLAPGSGHEETPEMRRRVLSFLRSTIAKADKRIGDTC